jgi:nitrogen fixation-related uncharacterized protein
MQILFDLTMLALAALVSVGLVMAAFLWSVKKIAEDKE